MIDVVTAVTQEEEQRWKRHQIGSRFKMIRNVFLHSTKIQFELLENIIFAWVTVMDTVQKVCYVLADNEED